MGRSLTQAFTVYVTEGRRMKKVLFRIAVLSTAILGVQACADQPTAPAVADGSAAFAKGGVKGRPKAMISKAIEVPLMTAAGVPAGTLSGVVYLTHVDIGSDGQLIGTARIIGTATTAAGAVPVDITQTTTMAMNGLTGTQAATAAATLAAAGDVTTQAVGACDVVNLVLGPLHLDLLGLVVDLNQVVLDVVAQTGAGNLLGNLLCAVVSLLDGVALLPIIGQLLERINDLLSILG